MVLVVTVYSVVMFTVCIVILVSMVTARDILEHDDDLTRTSNTDGRIGGVHSTLGYVAPLLRLLSYLVGSIVYYCGYAIHTPCSGWC
jgi:hypothetical protein